MKRIAIFASGSGTNAEAIMRHFAGHKSISVVLILTNKKDAGVIVRAERFKVPCQVFTKSQLEDEWLLETLTIHSIDYIILAGFLLKIPPTLTTAFPNKICNIHPALLPKFGGKGMYGKHVHEAVIGAGETESGITIHLVNEEYDKGRVLFQAKCPVLPNDSPDDLASRIHKLEHEHYPRVVEEFVLGKG